MAQLGQSALLWDGDHGCVMGCLAPAHRGSGQARRAGGRLTTSGRGGIFCRRACSPSSSAPASAPGSWASAIPAWPLRAAGREMGVRSTCPTNISTYQPTKSPPVSACPGLLSGAGLRQVSCPSRSSSGRTPRAGASPTSKRMRWRCDSAGGGLEGQAGGLGGRAGSLEGQAGGHGGTAESNAGGLGGQAGGLGGLGGRAAPMRW